MFERLGEVSRYVWLVVPDFERKEDMWVTCKRLERRYVLLFVADWERKADKLLVRDWER